MGSKDGRGKETGALTVLGTKEIHNCRDFSSPMTKRSPQDLGAFFLTRRDLSIE
jgi:hypothetical protein